MLRRLDIRNYVLIDSLEIEFPGGLIIITGQTGAGKSILLGALSLLLGAKAEASMIGESSDNCVVEAEFEADRTDAALKQLLEENEVDWNDGTLIVRRVINPTGRSRAFVNDSPVTAALLSSMASNLVDIHSQNHTQLLSDRHFQLSLLDHYAGNSRLLDEFKAIYRKFNSIRNDLSSLEKDLDEARKNQDYNVSRLERLEKASLREGEIEELEAEQKQLANAEEIKSSLYGAENLLTALAVNGEECPVTSILKDAGRQLDKISEFVPAAGALSERIESSRLELDDIISELSALNSRTEVSQDRLNEVDERLSLLYSLMQSYSCNDVSALIGIRNDLAASLTDFSQAAERLSVLREEFESCRRELEDAAAELSSSRRNAAAPFAASIQDAVRDMELPAAVFCVDVEPVGMTGSGTDSVLFRFSATGKNPVDVAKCASGGEKSRIMLALKSMMARYADMPTMIFDEIDTGVSGSVADKMGSVICDMGNFMQVFAITHLPQVAAKGSAHYLVSKDEVDGRAVSTIKRLSGSQRVLEIARMLSGSELTDAAVANAEALLAASQSSRITE